MNFGYILDKLDFSYPVQLHHCPSISIYEHDLGLLIGDGGRVLRQGYCPVMTADGPTGFQTVEILVALQHRFPGPNPVVRMQAFSSSRSL